MKGRGDGPTLPSDDPEKIMHTAHEKQGVIQATQETHSQSSSADSRLTDEPEYPTGVKLFTILISLAVSTFLVALDNTIIGTAIPKITDRFGALDDVGWYGSAYLFTLCAFQLLFGKLFTLFSIKWVYLATVIIFEIGSAICGAAPTSATLILGRAIAGIGAAGGFSGGLVIIAHTVPLAQRPMYTGLLGASWGIACVAGPLLGGSLTDHVSWRWCFYINLPIGTLVVIALFFTFNPPRRSLQENPLSWHQQMRRLDPLGTLAFIPGVVCCLLALQLGGSRYSWGNARIIILFIISGLLLVTFAVIQIKMGDNATVPLRIITQRSMIAGIWFELCLGGVMYVFLYFLPIWFQAIKAVSAWKSGVMLLPFLLGVILMSIVAGILVTAFGYYVPAMILSSVIMSIGTGLLTTFHITTGNAMSIGYQVLFGLGVGMGMQQPLMCAQTVLKLQDIPVGTSVIMFMQSLGGCVFLAVANNVFITRLIGGLTTIPGIDPSIAFRTGATDLSFGPAVKMVYNHSLIQTWYVPVALAALSIFGSATMEWRSVKEKKDSTVENLAGQLDGAGKQKLRRREEYNKC